MELKPYCNLPAEMKHTQSKEGTCRTIMSSRSRHYELARSIVGPVHPYETYGNQYATPEEIVKDFGAYENTLLQISNVGNPIQNENRAKTTTKSSSQDPKPYENLDAVNKYSN
ncbi:hypothetical protein ElyMa_004810800 [Elysia marginata]|uniref:Uncharacterized protein n=1 Tax=Elysia marginata TaxID=1093978 RepID=A0AAV4IJS3_9GAST|nr:hypothetical protein ElyMa_004810800 [Elysia marginata]